MSNHTHIAVHTIHRPGKTGKIEQIKPGTEFTPIDKAQADFLEENGAARRNKVAAASAPAPDGNGSPTGKKGDDKKSGKKDEELL